MKGYLNLTLPQRTQKCYIREIYDGNTVQTFYCYKDVYITFSKRPGMVTTMTDRYVLALLEKGLISQAQLEQYYGLICREYHFKDCHMEQSQTDIYNFICRCRYQIFGHAALAAGRQMRKDTAGVFDPAKGIDQRAKKAQLLDTATAAIFLLTAPELFPVMEADIRYALDKGTQVYICASTDGSGDLPEQAQLNSWLNGLPVSWLKADREGIAFEENLHTAIESGRTCLLFYGEEGLLHCRDLALDTVVTARPVGYHAQALCNLSGAPRDCVIYIPRGLDITPCVQIITQSRLTYYHLARLWTQYGDSIYTMTPEQLYRCYPEQFINFYDNRDSAPLPVTVKGDSLTAFDENKDRAMADYLNGFANITYTMAYFDEHLSRQPICYETGKKQPGQLVHTVRIRKGTNLRVVRCEKGVTPRQMFAEGQFPGTGITSNFLFFMTDKLDSLYNKLRHDRPYEQTDASFGHLDYMLYNENGVRKETFPLFRKCCLAMTKSGEILFFNYRLGGGCVQIAGNPLRWETADVDPVVPGDICVYTPHSTADAADADRETYRKMVGDRRVNFVILQDRIICVRRGDVILPGAGVVISLAEEKGLQLLHKLNLQALADGYYRAEDLPLQVALDGPAELDPALWQQVDWVYGGSLSLILDGVGMCDGDMKQWLQAEGWFSPLSRQTQESVYHQSVKHPRTVIGMTENGDLILLVISGRTWRSTGADYREITAIARAMYPDIKILMNMDGGGSSVLGMVHNGVFTELSCPATSTGSTVGMVRPISTMLYVPAEEELQ